MTGSHTQYVPIEVSDIPRSSWVERGACARSGSPFLAARPDEAACKKLCLTECPVQQLCLAYAIANNEPTGIWGGENKAERKAHKERLDVSRVPIEFRDHYLKVEGRVKRSHPTPHYVRNPNLDLVIDPDFIAFLDAM